MRIISQIIIYLRICLSTLAKMALFALMQDIAELNGSLAASNSLWTRHNYAVLLKKKNELREVNFSFQVWREKHFIAKGFLTIVYFKVAPCPWMIYQLINGSRYALYVSKTLNIANGKMCAYSTRGILQNKRRSCIANVVRFFQTWYKR